jgi:hypothetical protein
MLENPAVITIKARKSTCEKKRYGYKCILKIMLKFLLLFVCKNLLVFQVHLCFLGDDMEKVLIVS